MAALAVPYAKIAQADACVVALAGA
jgi:hypothetical protein